MNPQLLIFVFFVQQCA